MLRRVSDVLDHRARWRQVMWLASRQSGRVHADQLRGLGFTRSAIRRAMAGHRLIRRPGGIFLVGHVNHSPDGELWTAVLVGGPGAVVSHVTAAYVWRLLPRPSVLDVISPARWTTSLANVTIHQNELDVRRDVTQRHGVPTTTLLTTIIHLAAVASEAQLDLAVNEAAIRGTLHDRNAARLLEMSRGRRGAVALRAVLDRRDRSRGWTKSGLEAAFAALAREAGLPAYERGTHIDIGGGDMRECDVVWRAQRVLVELDFLPIHETGFVPYRDRRRDRRLTASGWLVFRLTGEDLTVHRDEVVADLRAALGAPTLAVAA